MGFEILSGKKSIMKFPLNGKLPIDVIINLVFRIQHDENCRKVGIRTSPV